MPAFNDSARDSGFDKLCPHLEIDGSASSPKLKAGRRNRNYPPHWQSEIGASGDQMERSHNQSWRWICSFLESNIALYRSQEQQILCNHLASSASSTVKTLFMFSEAWPSPPDLKVSWCKALATATILGAKTDVKLKLLYSGQRRLSTQLNACLESHSAH